ncbi:hypothetical protein [Kitasatospora paranensis]|uniref:Uncharacterized protein n=1 Tax=Kitasatospora paranensis TaxID=258053 RepID=A0ABW2FR56_9ACTN
MIGEGVRWAVPCDACGGTAENSGGAGVYAGRIEWSIEMDCPACGPRLTECGSGSEWLPAELRARLLAECGPARLLLPGPDVPSVALMKVLRSATGCDLPSARAAAERVRRGEWTGILAEVELLAEQLRAAGIEATARAASEASEASEGS